MTGNTDGKARYVTPYYAHFDAAITAGDCAHIPRWDGAIVCLGDKVAVRRIVFGHPVPLDIF